LLGASLPRLRRRLIAFDCLPQGPPDAERLEAGSYVGEARDFDVEVRVPRNEPGEVDLGPLRRCLGDSDAGERELGDKKSRRECAAA